MPRNPNLSAMERQIARAIVPHGLHPRASLEVRRARQTPLITRLVITANSSNDARLASPPRGMTPAQQLDRDMAAVGLQFVSLTATQRAWLGVQPGWAIVIRAEAGVIRGVVAKAPAEAVSAMNRLHYALVSRTLDGAQTPVALDRLARSVGGAR